MMVDSYDLLDMKLSDVSDLLLEKLCESGKDAVKVELPGCDLKTRERMKLVIFLVKGDDLDENK